MTLPKFLLEKRNIHNEQFISLHPSQSSNAWWYWEEVLEDANMRGYTQGALDVLKEVEGLVAVLNRYKNATFEVDGELYAIGAPAIEALSAWREKFAQE